MAKGRPEGKVAIVTDAGAVGPGWGNGRAMAVRFAEEGARVFAVDKEGNAAAGARGRRRRHAARLQRDRQPGHRRAGGGLHRALRRHRHPGQQRRRPHSRRACAAQRRRLAPAARCQPDQRVPHVQAGDSGDGGPGEAARSSTSPPPRASAGPALPPSAMQRQKPASSSSAASSRWSTPPRASG